MSAPRPAPNFLPFEFVRSTDFPQLALELEQLTPAQWIHIGRLLHTTMQPFRDFAGRLGVLSWVRSRELSEAIPGAKIGGDHEDGLAVDFRTLDMDAEQFLEAVRRGHVPRATFDKLNLYSGPGTFHAAHRPLELGPPRRRLYVDWQRVG